MLSIQYYPFGCQNGQQNRQHSSLRIALSAVPMLSVHAVHITLQSSFQAQYSTARSQPVEFPTEPTAQRIDSGDRALSGRPGGTRFPNKVQVHGSYDLGPRLGPTVRGDGRTLVWPVSRHGSPPIGEADACISLDARIFLYANATAKHFVAF